MDITKVSGPAITARLDEIRTRITRCLGNERADRQLALEDVDDALRGLAADIIAARL